MNKPVSAVALIAVSLLTGCGSLRAYEGERRDRSEVAVIAGDFRFTAGAPVSLILRRVDDWEVGAQHHAVEVLPGKHEFLIDCSVRETRRTTRHEVVATVAAGRRYALVAEMEPGLRGCSAVQLQPRD